jgi:hypothetical protein
VASTPTAWRVIERLARDPDGLARLRLARAHARGRAWAAGGDPAVGLLVIDVDATLVTAHTDAKEGAEGTYKHTFGFHPLLAYLDRGTAPGEPLAGILRPGNAAAGDASDLIALVELALAQLPVPAHAEPVLVRSDSAGASSRLAWHLHERQIGFSLGMPIDQHVREAILVQPEPGWTAARDADGQVRPDAQVCELTGWIDLGNWPPGTRAICRREHAHPGAQLRFTDHDGHRFQVFLTNQAEPDLARLELRHRQRARIDRPHPCRQGDRAAQPAVRPVAAHRRATPSGWSWSWPPRTSSAGPRRCCWTAPSPWPSPRPCATGCCMSPPASCATPAGSSCACRPPGPGRWRWPARSPGCGRCRCAADQHRHRPHHHHHPAPPGITGHLGLRA